MKTVFIFSKETGGGLRTYINSLMKLKNNFSFYFYFFKKDSYSKINSSKYLKKNITYLNETYPSHTRFSFNKIILFIKNLLKSFLLVKKNSPDIVITLDYYSYILISIIKMLDSHPFKFVATHHTNIINYLNNTKSIIFRFFFKKILIYLSKVPNINIFVSKGIKKTFLNHINKKIKYRVIYNSLHFYKKRKSRRSINIKKKPCLLITVGRLDNVQKDYDTLLKVVKKLIEEKINVFLYIIGDGPLRNQLLYQIKKLRINKNIKIISYRYIKSLYSYLNRADIFLFSSLFEGFGYVIIEAMSCGLPIIATNSPYGPSEILGNGKYGILVPIKDEKKFIFNIKKLINQPRLYEKYSKLSLIRSSYFNEDKMLKSYIPVLSDEKKYLSFSINPRIIQKKHK